MTPTPQEELVLGSTSTESVGGAFLRLHTPNVEQTPQESSIHALEKMKRVCINSFILNTTSIKTTHQQPRMSHSTNTDNGDVGKQDSCKTPSHRRHRLVPLLKEEDVNAVTRRVAHVSVQRGSKIFHLDVFNHYEYPPVLHGGLTIDISVNVEDGAQSIARSVLHKVYANLDISSQYSLGNDASKELRIICFTFLEFVESLDFKTLLTDVKTGDDTANSSPATESSNRVESEDSEPVSGMSMLAVRYMHMLLRVRFIGNSITEQSRSSDFERLYDGTHCRLMDLQMIALVD
jgi:hypothetical protein